MEKQGVPAALISTDVFMNTCKHMAKLGGIPEMQWAMTPHPLGSLPEDQLAERAQSAAEQFVAIVTGR